MENTKTDNKVAQKRFSNTFLIVILLGVLYFCYLIFKPFLAEILISGVLVTIFYPVYLKIVFWTKGRIKISALITCLLILSIIIVPFSFFVLLLAQQIIVAYPTIIHGLNNLSIEYLNDTVLSKLNFLDNDVININQSVIDSVATLSGIVLSYATIIARKASGAFAGFLVSLMIIVFTMFFMFIDGKYLLRRIMKLTPLSNKYDKLLWSKFRDVSYSTMVATVLTAFAQAFVGGIGFLIIGMSGLLAGTFIFITSFLPYVGTAIVWLPAAIYLIIIGKVWQGIFLMVWGGLVIGLIDNLLRPYLIKGKAQVHPLIIFFSIFGGIILFGVWGLIFGPLVVALAVTLLHIYELEYSKLLDR